MPIVILLIALITSVPVAAANDFEGTAEKIRQALAGAVRPEADIARDRNRKPIETLEFFGFRDNMKVLELLPGGGWYTRILAPVLAEQGELHVAIGTSGIEKNLLGEPGFEKVRVLDFSADNIQRPTDGSRYSGIREFEFPETGFDMVLTFRNMHSFSRSGRVNLSRAVLGALKQGGVFGVVDHTRRHMQADDPENSRRVDPVQLIIDVQSAGFELVDASPLHYRPDDELRYEVGRKTVTGNTDRFTLLFRKP